MPDFARSSDPAVQHQLDRLAALSPGGDVLGLDRVTRLLARLGDPHRSLPPVFHVAGTNGKGSTCAFLRAALEAAGLRVHVYTSPHLVRFNERIRLGGTLIEDTALAALLAEVFDACGDIGPSFFEVTTAATFLAFARNPADACVVEVGLGGRLDATNVLPDPAAAGIAALGLDHQAWLGHELKLIAREKAGIAKQGRPLVTFKYNKPIMQAIHDVAEATGAKLMMKGRDWGYRSWGDYITYGDAGSMGIAQQPYGYGYGNVHFRHPVLAGKHQHRNYMLAVAMLRNQDRIPIPFFALEAAGTSARWPARMQRLSPGPLTALLPQGSDVWLDGAHNPAAAQVVAAFLKRQVPEMRPLHIVVGLLANKDAEGVLTPLLKREAAFYFVPVPGHESHEPSKLVMRVQDAAGRAIECSDVASAFSAIAATGNDAPAVLVMGSLYLAGEVLRDNGQSPT